MRPVLVAALLLACLAGDVAHARDARPLFDFLFNEIAREQQRNSQRRLQQERDHQLFLSAWRDCFDASDIARCDVALGYPFLGTRDRSRLLARRTQILDEEARATEEAERLRREQAETAERGRRLAEERRLALVRDYEVAVGGCRRYVLALCNSALASPLLSRDDLARLQTWRSTANTYAASRAACQSGSLADCDAALASPALENADRPQLEGWLAAATSFSAAAAVSGLTTAIVSATADLPTRITALPTSTMVAGGIATALAVAVLWLAVRVRRGPQGSSGTPSPARSGSSWLHKLFAVTPAPSSRSAPAMPDRPPPLPRRPTAPTKPSTVTAPASVPPVVIDTPTAQRALRLAHAYLDEASHGSPSDPDAMRADRTTLSLAGKQLDIAFRADPDAKLEIDHDGAAFVVTQARLRARVLTLEALTWAMDNLKRACAIAERATGADPTCSESWRVLGMLRYQNRNKDTAVAALTEALSLDPDNIEIIKLLNRAQHMGWTEILGFKATKAAIGTANAGIGVYNTGVVAWNIFAFTWNVVTAPLRFVLWIAHGPRR